MQVETYECSETAAEPIEACEEAVQIMDDLGLDGQKSLVTQPEDEAAKRCPYRAMTKEEEFVFGVLCPTRTKIAQYQSGPIPLRVLQVAAHANSLAIYTALEVWHVGERPDPDPVLIGRIGGEYDWNIKARHLLARWSDELESWPVLVKRAAERKRQQVTDAFAVLARQLQRQATDAEMSLDELVEKGAEWKPELRL
jgi:hypothetical protein